MQSSEDAFEARFEEEDTAVSPESRGNVQTHLQARLTRNSLCSSAALVLGEEKLTSSFSLQRFCDLVFQGPLSVQEDWIKHLQRHIMNTGVPNSGLGMAEVTSLSENAPILKTDQDSSLSTAHAAS